MLNKCYSGFLLSERAFRVSPAINSFKAEQNINYFFLKVCLRYLRCGAPPWAECVQLCPWNWEDSDGIFRSSQRKQLNPYTTHILQIDPRSLDRFNRLGNNFRSMYNICFAIHQIASSAFQQSIGWELYLPLFGWLYRIGNISTYLHYMRF